MKKFIVYLSLLVFPLLLEAADCTISGPSTVTPPTGGTGWESRAGYNSSFFEYNGEKRLLVSATYGYYIYSLLDPDNPSTIATFDSRSINSTYNLSGDGQSNSVGAAVASDGSRFLLSAKNTSGMHGTLLLKGISGGASSAISGEFGSAWTTFGHISATKHGNRYIGHKWEKTTYTGGDITTFLTGSAAITPNSIPKCSLSVLSTTNDRPKILSTSSRTLLYGVSTFSTSVNIIDVTYPSGSTLNFCSTYILQSYAQISFGLDPAEKLVGVDIQEHPVSKELYFFLKVADVSNNPTKLVTAKLSSLGDISVLGTYNIPSPFTSGTFVGSDTIKLASNIGYVFVMASGTTMKFFVINAASPTVNTGPTSTFTDTYQFDVLNIFLSGNYLYAYGGDVGSQNVSKAKLSCDFFFDSVSSLATYIFESQLCQK